MVRAQFGLLDNYRMVIVVLLLATLAVGLWLLRRARFASFGVLAVALWVASAFPLALVLGAAYVIDAPRLNYVPSIGIALFWGALFAVGWQRFDTPAARTTIVIFLLLPQAWSIQYILARQTQAERFSAAINVIARDLQHTHTEGKVCKDRQLLRGVAPIHVHGRIGFCISKLLSKLQRCSVVCSLFIHLRNDVVASSVEDASQRKDLIGRKTLPQQERR